MPPGAPNFDRSPRPRVLSSLAGGRPTPAPRTGVAAVRAPWALIWRAARARATVHRLSARERSSRLRRRRAPAISAYRDACRRGVSMRAAAAALPAARGSLLLRREGRRRSSLRCADRPIARRHAPARRQSGLIQEVSQGLANSFGLESPGGALISSVYPDGAATKAGLEGWAWSSGRSRPTSAGRQASRA